MCTTIQLHISMKKEVRALIDFDMVELLGLIDISVESGIVGGF
jgi:hypothetical protein